MFRQALDLLTLPSRTTHVLGVNARNRAVIKPYNPRRHYPLADDKLRTKEVLEAQGIPVPRTLDVFSNLIEAASASERLQHLHDFVIKPASGRAGKGILVLAGQQTEDGWLDTSGKVWSPREISRWISNIIFGNYAHGLSDRALIEERLEPLPLLDDSPLFGLPDIRVLVFHGIPVLGMLRLPTRRSHGKANLHQGAIGVGVDLVDGRMTSASYRGQRIESHPDTDTSLIDRVVPHWSEVLDIARAAAAALPLGYLGIDVALDARRGPMILEVNVRPGLEIQNANGRGLRTLLAELEQSIETRDGDRRGEA